MGDEYLLDPMNTKLFPWNDFNRPPRVALLLLGHRDYQNDLGLHFAAQMAELLQAAPCEVLFEPQAFTDAPAAGAAARALLKDEPDGVIVCPGTWLEGDTALAAIREIEHLPFMMWALPMFDWEAGASPRARSWRRARSRARSSAWAIASPSPSGCRSRGRRRCA